MATGIAIIGTIGHRVLLYDKVLVVHASAGHACERFALSPDVYAGQVLFLKVKKRVLRLKDDFVGWAATVGLAGVEVVEVVVTALREMVAGLVIPPVRQTLTGMGAATTFLLRRHAMYVLMK
jgi:hypothetical protein